MKEKGKAGKKTKTQELLKGLRHGSPDIILRYALDSLSNIGKNRENRGKKAVK